MELAVHPADATVGHELFLMCEDLSAEMAALAAKGVRCSGVEDARWGSVTRVLLPSGSEVDLYEPKHPSPLVSADG